MSRIDSYTSAIELARQVKSREITAREVTEKYLERIEDINPRVHAILTVVRTRALEEAARIDQKLEKDQEVGALAGVPFVAKDLEWTEGVRTTMGSLVYRDFVPDQDSIAVARLRRAGAILIGKTNTCEFGLQLETTNRLGPDTRNPYDSSRTVGGSSGGSAAAVAAGLVPVATGSDSAGSIGNPSAFCGVVGLKPSHGRIPQWPDLEDSHLLLDTGPITRSVEDSALMLSVMSGDDGRDPVAMRSPVPDFVSACSRTPKNLRVAWSSSYGGWPLDPEVRDTFGSAIDAFRSFGYDLVEAHPDVEDECLDIYTPLFMGDAHVAFDHLLSQRPFHLDPVTHDVLLDARNVTLAEYIKAHHKLAKMKRRVGAFFDEYDILITPNNLVPAFPALEPPPAIDGEAVPQDWTPHLGFLTPWNLAGNPHITVPAGRSSDGLPISILLVAAIGDEELLFEAASAFERGRPWSNIVPDLDKLEAP